VKYVGDLSKYDATVLEKYGKWSGQTLEFGMGASTQILAQCSVNRCKVWSMETDPNWIARTKRNLDILGVPPSCYMLMDYDLALTQCDGALFDLIFVDGIDEERFPFALATFQRLKYGGWMLFHDTRRMPDLRTFLDVLLAFKDEVGDVKINMDHSNISGIQRKIAEPYYDWRVEESRTDWMIGAEEPPENWPEML
jgi:hypothetical protein